MDSEVVIALVVGVLQGIFEWLPVSSEGNVTVVLTALGSEPEAALQYSLFLHVGTALAATVYYRDTLAEVGWTLPELRPDDPFRDDTAQLSFLVLATLASGVVGIAAYLAIEEVVSELTGGTAVALIGVLLVATGVLQRTAGTGDAERESSPTPAGGPGGHRETPTAVDAVLVGALQGLAILPGVSRSGTTVSALLLRGYEGEASFRLSFLLSVPAALGAGVLAVLDGGGLPTLNPAAAGLALATAALVGYLTIDALMRVVKRVAFWGVCVGLGTLAIVGGGLAILLA
ncbi:undecaprenyl-diphosphate phosphatase [Haloarchaeobius iranensis]|uniref:Undecaprenyl-diphosphatase n=1 Tax=Haloarchaeobius iranensis TaxID=996166 RepID=A0A1G9ZHU5_9EURY|nr:undecaprenyl-diphosphate phosphatase [Haloarchaeobius iranensis]SDN20940.1 undecaprenyl-diphosphatase [Haloarchaeobius iranensis]